MAEHTPGPWAVSRHGETDPDIPGSEFSDPNKPDEFYGTAIWAGPALVFVDEHYGRNISTNPEADVRLIAAAPDLLAALDALCDAPLPDAYDKRWAAANDAIAKATGKEA